jgi:hypothetical protein
MTSRRDHWNRIRARARSRGMTFVEVHVIAGVVLVLVCSQ